MDDRTAAERGVGSSEGDERLAGLGALLGVGPQQTAKAYKDPHMVHCIPYTIYHILHTIKYSRWYMAYQDKDPTNHAFWNPFWPECWILMCTRSFGALLSGLGIPAWGGQGRGSIYGPDYLLVRYFSNVFGRCFFRSGAE